VRSPELGNTRDIVVALPPSYSAGTGRYPVVYFQDGQNLFDPETSFANPWGLGAVLGELAAAGQDLIAVAIPNQGIERVFEYSPFVDRSHRGGGGDRYVRFVAGTVKGLVDRNFRTLPDRGSTAIAGASMGGLISLYALYRYREWIGGAIAMSPAVWFGNRAILRYVTSWPEPPLGRLYLDVGLAEPRTAVADARTLRNILRRAGSHSGLEQHYVEDESGTHSEESWGRRMGPALSFLLGGSRSPASIEEQGVLNPPDVP
jgi:predicted alpha/beta superfamily hydrolase